MAGMIIFVSILLGVTLAVLVGVLLTGVVAFVRGGAFHQRYATRLMNLRVCAQFVALLLFALLIHLTR